MSIRSNGSVAIVAIVFAAAGVIAAPAAFAADDPVAAIESVSEFVPSHPDVLSDVAVPLAITGDGIAAASLAAGVSTSLPSEPSQPISVTSDESAVAPLEISLPFADTASSAVVDESGAVSYNNNNGSSSVIVAKGDGSVQIASVIGDASAPTRYDYEYSVPEGGGMALDEAGAAVIVGADGVPVASVQAPWAYDANGRAIPTQFEVNGATLTQVVEHSGAAYPVVADPQTLYFWWGQALKFTRSETATIAASADNAGVVSVVCGLIASAPGAVVCGIATFLLVNSWAKAFISAAAQGRCGQLNMPYVGIIIGGPLTWQTYNVTC